MAGKKEEGVNSFMTGECGTPANSTGCSDRAPRGAGSDPDGAGTIGSALALCWCELLVAVPGGVLEPEALLELELSPILAQHQPLLPWQSWAGLKFGAGAPQAVQNIEDHAFK